MSEEKISREKAEWEGKMERENNVGLGVNERDEKIMEGERLKEKGRTGSDWNESVCVCLFRKEGLREKERDDQKKRK